MGQRQLRSIFRGPTITPASDGAETHLLKNTRKTVAVSSVPPKGLTSFFPVCRRESAPFALLKNTRKTVAVSSVAAQRADEFLSCLAARIRALCAFEEHGR